MRTLHELLFPAIGVTVTAVLIYLLLSHGHALGPWMLALFLLGHGWVHMMFAFPTSDPAQGATRERANPFVLTDSWLISRAGLDQRTVRLAGLVLITATFLAFLLAALATLGWVVPTGWWPALVVAAAVLSTLVLVLFYSPLLLLGFALNATLIWLALSSWWSPMSVGAG